MTPIDLVDYATSSKKIPQTVLKHKSPEKTVVPHWKIVSGYFMDFMMAAGWSLTLGAFLKFYFKGFMISNSLVKAFNGINFSTLNLAFIPLFFGSYYFFSYFFNRGQSWGLHSVKARIEMPQHSFRASMLWTGLALGVTFTGGLAYTFLKDFYAKKGWGSVQSHDHLYGDLMQERVLSPVTLVHHTTPVSEATETVTVSEDYFEAA